MKNFKEKKVRTIISKKLSSKITLLIITILFLNIFTLNVNALNTYVGVKILDLKDESGNDCIGKTTENGGVYGAQGRIRALSSYGDFPIFIEIKYQENDSIVWAGNISEEGDYGIDSIFYTSSPVSLNTGIPYTLMFDIDMIKIFLDLPTSGKYYEFEYQPDGMYYTNGLVGNSASYDEYGFRSESNNCEYYNIVSDDNNDMIYITPNQLLVNHACIRDSTSYNCRTSNVMGIVGSAEPTYTGLEFFINERYSNLYEPHIGNFWMYFEGP